MIPLQEQPHVEVQSAEELRAAHREIVRLLLLGAKPVEIAEELGMTPASVRAIQRSPLVQEHLGVLQERRDASATDVATRIKQMVPLALDFYEEVISNPGYEDKLRKDVADQILDRGGLPKQSRVSSESIHTSVVTSVEIIGMQQRALDAARRAGLLVDTTATEIGSVSVANDASESTSSDCRIENSAPSTPLAETGASEEADQAGPSSETDTDRPSGLAPSPTCSEEGRSVLQENTQGGIDFGAFDPTRTTGKCNNRQHLLPARTR